MRTPERYPKSIQNCGEDRNEENISKGTRTLEIPLRFPPESEIEVHIVVRSSQR